ncbi:hypothetical protein S7711_09327 [Stachybotrys chartarum IBT 7711]|uniref:Dehydrogenase FUB6 n=1 Tax=Stachybotrys chartarum (strain CBS 109288 / IBT 7711) TaxID=1280523 RepID=A0A084ARR8_STACB|nr:hypothetical protein S7711_09327 [Stachybotrys chartarum IBT 7711]
MATTNLEVIYTSRPTDGIIPDQTFTVRSSPAPTAASLADNQLLVECLYLSLDPIMRMWLDGVDYMPMSIGDRMRGWTIVRVLASRAPNVKPGTVGIAETGWTQYAAIDAAAFTTFAMPEGMPLPDMLGAVGFTGLTGYFGMWRVGRPKQGDVVVVSTAAGATGSIAAQVAKIQGAARVVGITGSNDKCAWLTDELKLDVALNYKAPDFKEQFAKATEGGINVYYDNVGGEMLELALSRMAMHGRIVICGQISGYNSSNPRGVTNLHKVFEYALSIEGINIFEHLSDSEPARAELSKWYREGKLRSTTTVLKGGLEAAPQALVDLFAGKNTGKCLVEITAKE